MRNSVPILAATLLLGFYELWNAEHMKWNSHLAGAKQLVIETDYKGMYQQLRQMKAEQAARYQRHAMSHYHTGTWVQQPANIVQQDLLLDQFQIVDAQIVSSFVGRAVSYDDFGHIIHSESTADHAQKPGLDIAEFEMLQDLFWWYCKQDVYQSIVSGNPLLMPFDHWTDCPPRGPMGQSNAVHGSYDHLILLLGRIADFAARDRKRKIKSVEATGGQWRPAPGMQIGPSPTTEPVAGQSSTGDSNTGRSLKSDPEVAHAPQQSPGPPQVPAFYGMAPPPPKISMPPSYQASAESYSPDSTHSADTYDLAAATKAAMDEWKQIKEALHAFANMLGTQFRPLGPDVQQPLQTAFGPALFFRSYDMSCLWAIYNMVLIIAERSHPHMPPHAHMAAGVAAYQTRHFANEIGRIAAGIVPPPESEPLNPTIGAAFCELCVPLFFAGVQIQHPAQRQWVVTRLFDVERRCGYPTAGLIANGCQTAWHKAFLAGRGPKYERQYNTAAQDWRLNGKWEGTSRHGEPREEDDPTDRRFVHTVPSARLHWAMGIIGMEDDK